MAKAKAEKIVAYQALLKREKLALLALPAARQALSGHIDYILGEGLFRSLKRDLLREIQGVLDKPSTSTTHPALGKLVELPFYEEVWNKARQAVQADPSGGAAGAFPKWEKMFVQAAEIRNEFLDEYAFLIPKMLRYYFQNVGPALMSELESEAILGLFRALESFDVEKKGGDLRIHIQTRILSTLMDFYKGTEYAKVRMAQKSAQGKDDGGEEEGEKGPRTLISNLSGAAAEGRDDDPMGAALISLEDMLPQTEDSHYADVIVGEEGNPFEVAEGRELLQRLADTLKNKTPLERFFIQSKWNMDEGVAHAELLEPSLAAAKMRAEASRRLREALGVPDKPEKKGKK